MCISLPARVVAVDGAEALVAIGTRERRISLAPLVLDGMTVLPGDRLLVHTGFAVARLTNDEADELDAALRALTEPGGP